METMDKVTVRLPAETIRLLQELVDNGEFPTMADAVRSAVDKFIGDRFTPETRIEIIESPRDDDIIEMNALVRNGDSVLINDSVCDSVRDYIRNRLDKGF